MEDFIKVINMANNVNVNLSIEDIYNFRKLNREIYTKGDLIGDLNGDLLKVRDIKRINLISVDLTMFSITLEDTDDQKLSNALDEISKVLKGFLKRFSYLSSLTAEEADKYEYYLNMYPVIDVIKCGNSVLVTM
jgi:hypothetical protein